MAFAKMGDRERTWELLQMINPVNHGKTAAAISTYKVEPYVVAADVYAVAPHNGRGGWTWYTGSAGWLYQLIIESFMGISIEQEKMYFSPCLPMEWPSVSMQYRHGDTMYLISIMKGENGVGQSIMLDGIAVAGPALLLQQDGGKHEVIVKSS